MSQERSIAQFQKGADVKGRLAKTGGHFEISLLRTSKSKEKTSTKLYFSKLARKLGGPQINFVSVI